MGKGLRSLAGSIGVASAAPFGVGAYTIVSSTAPPIITAGRLKQVADAGKSITAIGVNATSADTLVIGSGANDSTNVQRGIYLGLNVVAPAVAAGQGNDQILIGANLTPNVLTGQNGLIAIGSSMTFTGAGGSGNGYGHCVLIGENLTITGADAFANVCIGASSTTTGGTNVVIGNGTSNTTGQAVVIGQGSTGGGQSTVLGQTASSGAVGGTALGWNAQAGTSCVGVGFAVRANGTDTVCLGRDATDGGFTNAVVLGRGSTAFENNSLVIGNRQSNSIAQVRWGVNRQTSFGGMTWTFTRADLGANNNNAPSLTIQAGIGTGNAVAGGRIIFQTGLIQAGGTTDQPWQTVFELRPGGTAGNPTIAFVNQISTVGASAGTLTNAPSVGNPTVWAEVLYNGVLRKIPMW